MSRAIDVDEDEYRIRWDDDLGAAVHEWRSFVSGEDFRDPLRELTDVIEERSASKLLVDQRGMNVVDDDDMVWLVNECVPEMVADGLEYSVIVIQESVIAEMTVERVMEEVSDVDGESEVTTDVDEARELVGNY